jgi:F0F1-type ATP synthase assembly protein I
MAKDTRGIGAGLSLGLEIAVGVGLGLYVGSWLDKRYGWQSWGAMLGAMLGLSSALYLVIKQANRINRD